MKVLDLPYSTTILWHPPCLLLHYEAFAVWQEHIQSSRWVWLQLHQSSTTELFHLNRHWVHKTLLCEMLGPSLSVHKDILVSYWSHLHIRHVINVYFTGWVPDILVHGGYRQTCQSEPKWGPVSGLCPKPPLHHCTNPLIPQ